MFTLKYKALSEMNNPTKTIRRWIVFFMIALFFSGLTAIPVESELRIVTRFFPPGSVVGDYLEGVYIAVVDMHRQYPFLFYGYDWLAFAHFVLAILFIGPYRDPVRNRWVIEFGLIACALIIPFAFIAGHYRGIPLWWTLIDCSFGVIGFIPLGICLSKINQLEHQTKPEL